MPLYSFSFSFFCSHMVMFKELKQIGQFEYERKSNHYIVCSRIRVK